MIEAPSANTLPVSSKDMAIAAAAKTLADFLKPRISGGAQKSLAAMSAAQAFVNRYFNRPDLFVLECIKHKPGRKAFKYQLKILLAVANNARVSWRGPRGLGKCLAFDEIVTLADGSLVNSQDLIGKYFDVVSVDSKLNRKISKAYAFDNGIKDVVEITTKSGRVIRRTLNHPLWADNTPRRYGTPEYYYRLSPEPSWITAGDIKEGAVISLALDTCPAIDTSEIDDDNLRLAAYLLADGNVSDKASIKFSQAPGPVLDEFQECCHNKEVDLLPIGTSGYDYALSNTNKVHRGFSKGIAPSAILEKTREWGLQGKNSFDKSFPNWVWNLDKARLALFISRLYACDGWCCTTSADKVRREIGYTSVSKVLASDVQRALLRLGINAKLYSKKTSWTYLGEKKTGLAYVVGIHDIHGIKKFCTDISIFGKEDAIDDIMLSSDLVESHSLKWKRRNLPENYEWDTVKSVTVISSQPTVGITVPGDATFLTDFVEHNTTTMAWIILWFSLTRDIAGIDWKIPTTASVDRQLTRFLWPEVHKWARLLDWTQIPYKQFSDDQLMVNTLKLEHGEAFKAVSNDPDKIEGAHADELLYVLDESKAIVTGVFDALEGAFSVGNVKVVCGSTPGPPAGRFYEINTNSKGYEDWVSLHVTAQEILNEGNKTFEKWREQRRKQWGENSAVFQTQCEGEFATEDSDTVIPHFWITLANERWLELADKYGDGKTIDPAKLIEDYPFVGVGVDVGMGSENGARSTLATRFGDVIAELRSQPHDDTMTTVGRAKAVFDKWSTWNDTYPSGVVIVDANGVGAGVLHRLKEVLPAQHVTGFMAQEANDSKDVSQELGFINLRSYAWWNLRERLDPAGNPTIAIPPDSELIGELVSPKYKITSTGKIQVESKETIMPRLGRSTDGADAVVQIMAASAIRSKRVHIMWV